MKTISVCMTTYNGEKYIVEQLYSIWNQSLKPDEVIICDDHSGDETVKQIEAFIISHKLQKSWHLYRNEQNRGYPGNVYYAMSLCRGDIVFLADQDDVWKEDKIEKMYQVFSKQDAPLLLASGWGIIDENGAVVTKEKKTSGNSVNISVNQIFCKYLWPGMSMCYANAFGKDMAEKLKDSKVPHDMALALYAAERGKFTAMDDCLQYHRNHAANEAMEEHRIFKLLNKKRKLIEIKRYLNMLEGIIQNSILINSDNQSLALKKRAILLERQKNLEQKKFFGIIRQYLKNRDVVRCATMICDCLICWQKG